MKTCKTCSNIYPEYYLTLKEMCYECHWEKHPPPPEKDPLKMESMKKDDPQWYPCDDMSPYQTLLFKILEDG